MQKKRICLNMIVKNETPVLGRLFASVQDVISYYVIVDTGSTDGTPEFIEQWMAEAGIPGELHRHEWVNFGVNRNQALDYAYQCGQADWLLIIDADEEFACSDLSCFQKLKPGVNYRLEKRYGSVRYGVLALVDIAQTRWRWQGVVHEYLEHVEGPDLRGVLPEAWIIIHAGQGARSVGISEEEKFLKDAALLEAELARKPEDCRSRFYLAQSYKDAGHMDKAYENYLLRADMPGWEEENYVAQYRAGKMAVALGRPYGEIVALFLKAYEMRPGRGAEPLHDLAAYCRHQNWFAQAYLFAKMGSQIAYPDDILFVETDIFQWRILDELAVSAYWTGRYAESRDACNKILKRSVPAEHIKRIKENLDFAVQKLRAK